MSEQSRVMVLRCPGCKKKVLKYLKVGQGRVIRCYKDRIQEDRSVRSGLEVLCRCGQRIGIDQGDHIKILGDYRLD